MYRDGTPFAREVAARSEKEVSPLIKMVGSVAGRSINSTAGEHANFRMHTAGNAASEAVAPQQRAESARNQHQIQLHVAAGSDPLGALRNSERFAGATPDRGVGFSWDSDAFARAMVHIRGS